MKERVPKNAKQIEELETEIDVVEQEKVSTEPTIEHDIDLEKKKVEIEKEAEEVPDEGTSRENRTKLREVVGKFYESAKEKLGMSERGKQLELNLEYRSKELDAEAKKLGITERAFRWVGEQYNKRSTREKILIGIALGLGAGVSATSISLVGALGLIASLGGLAAQRVAGLSSMFLKYENTTQDGKWFNKKEKAMGKAMLHSAVMTAGMLLLVQEIKLGVDYKGHMFDANKEWLKHYWPGHAPEVPTTDVGGMAGETVAPIVAPNSPEMPAISIEAKAGHGYEWMMKRMWEQLHEQNATLPANVDPDSDFAKLINADATTIDKVVHQIAADPGHGFFNADGTSVQINPDAHMTIGADAQINLDNVVHAPESAPVMPAYYPEAPVSVAEAPSTPPEITQPVEPIIPPEEMPIVEASTASAGITQPVEPFTLLTETPATNTPEAPLETEILKPEAVTSPEVPVAPAETPASPVEPPVTHVEQTPITYVENPTGLHVEIYEPHIYAGSGGKELFVYGGSPEAQANTIESYLNEHPKDVVFGASDDGATRIRFFLDPDGKITADLPIKKSFWERLFSGSAFIEAPRPEEFEKIINIK